MGMQQLLCWGGYRTTAATMDYDGISNYFGVTSSPW